MKNENGNVIFYILIAVGLLAALSYTVARSSRGTANVSAEQMSLSASEVVQFTNSLSNAVTQLRLRGCTEAEISFDNVVDAGTYDNAFAPADESCDVFGVSGGGLGYNQNLSYLITSGYVITDVGTSAPDLIVDVTVSKSVCETLNDSLDIDNSGTEGPPSDAMIGAFAFDGSYAAIGGGANGQVDDAQFVGKRAACRHDSGSGSSAVFKYYKVLMAR